jgi:transcriptional regulator with XRE-family HTH domain
MSSPKATSRKKFSALRKQIDADPVRRARVREHKAAMLAELRRELDLTQAVLADRLEVSQENVSQIERGGADVRLSTLSRYVKALGGRLEVRAEFPDRTVALRVGEADALRRTRTSGSQSRKAATKPADRRKGKLAAAQAGGVAGARAAQRAGSRGAKIADSDERTAARTRATKRHG